MLATVDIDVTKVPYNFDVNLNNKIYNIALRYNILFDFFTADLSLNGTILIANEKLILKQFLFREVYEDLEHNINPNFPNELLYIGCNDSKVKRASLDNLGDTVNLYVIDREDVLPYV